MNGRYSGILLPVSALPGPYGIGNFGRSAYEFIDYLKSSQQSFWQVLPLGPTSVGDSPYQSFSSFAGNPYFIDLDQLIAAGLLTLEEAQLEPHDPEVIDYGMIYQTRITLLRTAFARAEQELLSTIAEFRAQEDWLADYALFMSLKTCYQGAPWVEWPEQFKMRHPEALAEFQSEQTQEIGFWCFVQYCFFEQWQKLRSYAESQGIKLIGDLPLYVAQDSVEVWANPELFQLDEELLPKAVAGFPPDDFSEVGQLWGNPLFDWARMQADSFQWWQRRLNHQMRLFHILRLDHFIGFHRYWSIPYGDRDATNGHWEMGPGSAFFDQVQQRNPSLDLIAEDLGIVTEEVHAMRKRAGLPSMRVLQFGFDPLSDSEHAPHHLDGQTIAYTGTHDNETVLGWWGNLSPEQKDYVRTYLGFQDEAITPALLRALFQSGAKIAIVTLQDLLGQDNQARINTPNSLGNWTYRVPPHYLEQIDPDALTHLTITYRRQPDEFI